MKKTMIALSLVAVAGSASALELGVTGGYTYGGDRGFAGVTAGQKFTKQLGIEGSIEHANKGEDNQTRVGVVGTYDFAKLGPVTLTGKAGIGYLKNDVLDNGYVATAGVGAALPVTENMDLTVEYRYQWGQNRVKQFDGSAVFAGIKYKF